MAVDTQKYVALVCTLPTEVATQVSSVITNSPSDNKFAALRSGLQTRYQRSHDNLLQDLASVSLGDSTPARLWEELQRLNDRCPEKLPNDILRQLHRQKLPSEVHLALSAT